MCPICRSLLCSRHLGDPFGHGERAAQCGASDAEDQLRVGRSEGNRSSVVAEESGVTQDLRGEGQAESVITS